MGQKRYFILSIAIIIVFCITSLGLFFGCQFNKKGHQLKPPSSDTAEVTVEKSLIKEHIEKLIAADFQGRRAGTAGEAEAALYLAGELKKIGLEPLGDKNTYFQSFPIPQTDLRWEEDRLVFFLKADSSTLLSDNVLGGIKSSKRPEEYIILSAHFDHLGVWENQLYPGANDNASGVSAVLEIARLLKYKDDLPYSVIIAFWGGEEMGLIGSNFFVDKPPINLKKIKLAINLDSIGTGTENDFLFWSDGQPKVTDALYSQWQKWQSLSFTRQNTSHNSSDHKALARGSIPAVTILANDWLIDNHTTHDDCQGLNYEKIASLSQNIVGFLISPEIVDIVKEK